MDLCVVCCTPFKRHYRRGGERQIYCSKKCKYAAGYTEQTCRTCQKSFRVNYFGKQRVYCSLECTQRHDCELCGIPITGRNTMNGRIRRFCSRECASMMNGTLSSKTKYRRLGFAYTLERKGKLACERCDEDDIWVLHVHHVQGRSFGNNRDNLITLCANCHDREHRTNSADRLLDIERATSLVAALRSKRQQFSCEPSG